MSHKKPHQWLLYVKPNAQSVFDTLPPENKRGVFRKLRELLLADDPYSLPWVEMLKDKRFERVRKFWVGDYRVFIVVEVAEVKHQKHTYKGTLFLLDIRDRKAAY